MVRSVASLVTAVACLASMALTGCAAFNVVDSDVSSFGKWPAGRAPSSYAFERLPSQQADPKQAQMLEDAARPAVEAAGFVASAPGSAPDVTIQLGARITAVDRSPFDDPFWYGAGPYGRPFFYARYGRPLWGPWGPGWGPGWGRGYGSWNDGFPYYEREAAVLIRDKSTGEPLFEARANSDGSSWDVSRLLPAMFGAAMKDFPNGVEGKAHRVRTQIGG